MALTPQRQISGSSTSITSCKLFNYFVPANSGARFICSHKFRAVQHLACSNDLLITVTVEVCACVAQ